jgi:hypothetical protein
MRKKKFKVGDKVLITKGHRNFVESMEKWIGQVATITKLRHKTSEGHMVYDIDLDEGKWAWVFEHGHFVSIDDEKKPRKEKMRNVLKYGDEVTFKLVGKGNYEYIVRDEYLNTDEDTNALIFIKLGMSAQEKIEFCRKAYGYEPRHDGQWPECRVNDYEALTRCVTMLHQECNVLNKRMRDLVEELGKEIEV